jgi:hypothetical protein
MTKTVIAAQRGVMQRTLTSSATAAAKGNEVRVHDLNSAYADSLLIIPDMYFPDTSF